MTWAKLPNAGDSLTMIVKQCGEHKSPSGDLSVRFDSRNDETVYLPRLVGEHWLRELGYGKADGVIDYDKAIGQRLKFSRVAAPVAGDRPHWKIEAVREVVIPQEEVAPVLNDHLPPAGESRAAFAKAAEPGSVTIAQIQIQIRRDAIDNAYEWAHGVASRVQQKAAKKKGAPKPTAESIENGVTTLMLRAERMNAI